jgi:hypothetical protein
MSPKTKLTLYVWWGILTFIAFFAIRFDVVYYRDTKIVCWGPYNSFLTESKDVIVLGNYTLATDYGPLYLNSFCKVSVMGKIVSGLDVGKNSSHDMRLLGQELEKNIMVSFGHYGIIDGLSGEYNFFSLGTNTFTYSTIFFKSSSYFPNEMLFANLVFDRIVLDDGTEIVFSEDNSYDLRLDLEKNDWTIDFSARRIKQNKYYFFVKRPGEQEYTKYTGVRFEPYWVNFLDGTVFQEPVEEPETEETPGYWGLFY